MTTESLNPPFPPDSLYAALANIVKDPSTRRLLEEADPMALEQADTALSLNPERPVKPLVVICEIPQDDPTVEVVRGDAEIILHSTYHFSKYASEEEAHGATETILETLRTHPRDDYWTWLEAFLREQLAERDRDFVVDWDDFTLLTKCHECGGGYDESTGDGYMGACPKCADEAELIEHLREVHDIDENDLRDRSIDRKEGHAADHADRDDLDHTHDDGSDLLP